MKTTTLDHPLEVNDTTVAAVVSRTTQKVGRKSALFAKRPLAILLHAEGTTSALDSDGRHLTLQEFREQYPGLLDAFTKSLNGI